MRTKAKPLTSASVEKKADVPAAAKSDKQRVQTLKLTEDQYRQLKLLSLDLGRTNQDILLDGFLMFLKHNRS